MLDGNEDPYVGFLRSRRHQTFHLKPYPGNSGDVLIRLGTEAVLARLGIKHTVDPRRADVILYPGGNPTMWGMNIEVWVDCWTRFPKTEFVVGPATFQPSSIDWPSIVRSSTGTITALFARDPASYRNLQGAGLPVSILTGLAHDPAIHLRESQWVAEHRMAASEEYVLASFRDDHESELHHLSGFSAFIESVDWPLIARLRNRRRRRRVADRLAQMEKLRDPTLQLKVLDASRFDFASFVECVRRCRELHTDRLHAMLLAALLGKRTYAYPTAYDKLEAVYEHSLRGWADVRFAADAAGTGTPMRP